MNGALGGRIRDIRQSLIRDLAEIESKLDFPEEDLDFTPVSELSGHFQDSLRLIRNLLGTGAAGAILRNGIRIVLAGSPNSGKSSLLNALLGYERAIVSAIPGTTRDTVEENLNIHGVLCQITDTAGLHEDSDDPVENIGIGRTRKSLLTADVIVWLLDASRPDVMAVDAARMKEEVPEGKPCLICFSKMDIASEQTSVSFSELAHGFPYVALSAAEHSGFQDLLNGIESLIWKNTDRSEPECAVSERHRVLLQEAESMVEQASQELFADNPELAATCLHQALARLGTITGETVNPDLLDEIFSRFCIGK